jgi:uncharacterized protein YbjT (DUF2867 family)
MNPPSKHNILILGATGAVGTEVIRTLSIRPDVAVTALSRRPLTENYGATIKTEIVDPLDPKSYANVLIGHDVAVCTLGVGQPSKVSRDEYVRVDHDAVLAFARVCKNAGIRHFLLLGSVASDPKSGSFYLASKGRLRESISALGFDRFSCFQPSMLLTKTNRYNWVQGLMLVTWPIISKAMVGPLRKYRGVKVEDLGAAMANRIFTSGQGTEILHWDDFS